MFGKTIIDLIMELLFICNNYFLFFQNTKYFNIHTQGEREEGFKEINSSIYPKEPNSWIHSLKDFNPNQFGEKSYYVPNRFKTCLVRQ